MGDLDYSGWRLLLQVLQLASLAIIGAYTFVVNRTKANKTAIDEIEDRVDDNDRRIDVMETRLDVMPTHADLGKLYERLNGVAERLENLTGQLGTANHQLQLIHDYLLNSKDGGRCR